MLFDGVEDAAGCGSGRARVRARAALVGAVAVAADPRRPLSVHELRERARPRALRGSDWLIALAARMVVGDRANRAYFRPFRRPRGARTRA